MELSITTQSQKPGTHPYPPMVPPKITMNGQRVGQVANDDSWTSFPANYLFLGTSSMGNGQGVEVFERATSSSPIQSTLTNSTETG